MLSPEIAEALVNELVTQVGVMIESAAANRPHGKDPVILAAASYGFGVQFGLELSQLDPIVAQQLITHIHEQSADARDEHNYNAMLFIKKWRAASE